MPKQTPDTSQLLSSFSKGETPAYLLQAALQHATSGVVIVDRMLPDHPMIYCNSAFEKMTGYSAPEVIGRNCRFLQCEDRDQPGASALRVAIESGKACRAVLRNYRKNGELFWNEINIWPVLDSSGQVTHYIGIQNDVSDVRQTTDQLVDSESKLASIFETAVEGIVTIDSRGAVLSFNPAASSIFGYTRDEAIGKNVTFLMPQPYHDEHDKYLSNYLETGEKKIIGIGREVVGLRKDGSQFPMDLSVSEVKTAEGRIFTGFIRDISTRKEFEEEIAEAQRQMSTLLSNLPGAAFRCQNDRDWTMDFISEGCLALTGWSASQFHNKEVSFGRQIIHPAERERVWNRIQRAIDDHEPYQMTYEAVDAAGRQRWYWEQGRGIYTPSGDLSCLEGFCTDITELKVAQDRLVQAERLSVLGVAMTTLAHESRNLLQRIQMAVETGRLDAAKNPAILRQCDLIENSTDSLQLLLEEVRNYAAPIVLEKESYQLATVIKEAWQSLNPQRKGRDATLELSIEPTVSLVLGDRLRLGQVFRNLLENSLAACSDPVLISVVANASNQDGEDMIAVSLQDNGPGLSREQHEQVFEPFFTTRSSGTGLGMSIAQRIVEAHGGKLKAEPSNQGARFLVSLPQY